MYHPPQQNNYLKSDPQIKDHHLAQAVREMSYSKEVQAIYEHAAVIAAKEVK